MSGKLVRGTTQSGFAYELDPSVGDDMEMVDSLAELSDGNTLAVSSICLKLLGKEQRKRLYDHLRNESGRVPTSAVEVELKEMFDALGEDGKN